MNRDAVTALLPHRTLGFLLLTLAAVAAPHAPRLPIWITLVVVVCGAWRYRAGRRGLRLPPRWLLLVFTASMLVGIVLSYGTLLGLDAGVAVLTAMLGLKLLELRRRRDAVVSLYLGYFLVVTQLLYQQSLTMLAYMLPVVWAMTTLLITVNRPDGGRAPLEHARLSATMLCQALPVMLVLFLLFPRLPGPLWSMPETDRAATTGLSDIMEPGSISNLAESDAVAFRVEFDGDIPAPRERYWRGPVLPVYDGRRWSQPENSRSLLPAMESLGGDISYTLTLEPHNRRWLMVMDMPVRISIGARVDSEYHVHREQRISNRLRYRATSMRHYRLDPELPRAEAAPYRYLPDGSHPRTVALAREWRQRSGDTEAFIRRALEHFREEPFVYTLQPPLMTGDAVDAFLFGHRRGFCEHYAAAFAVLMRAGGVPARVVTGYQGGEINPTGGYLIVRQSDAHAWTEVHVDGEGWRRIDPTAWVAPERIESGVAGSVADPGLLPAMARRDTGWSRGLRLRWDAINAYWDRWVLAYGPELQGRLMERLRLGGARQMLVLLVSGITLVLGLVAAGMLWRLHRPAPDPVLRDWERFCHKLARLGTVRRPDEGPADFARRAAERHPELASAIHRITRCYVAVRYGRMDNAGRRRQLHRAVSAFRP